MAELANERREHMTTLREQLEEAEERLAEANYRLGTAAHFERLVKRRKGLIRKLLDALRAKMKAIVALKAGLEGLRTYKAAAEMNQQKLLQRIDALKTELREVEDDAAADLRERDATITRLMVTIREQEANARKLSEASESWRRQYQLLASHSTTDYKTAGEN
jgi:chromosome segregation ATPase